MLDTLNWYISRDEIDVTEYSPEYPVTIEDIIYRWEAVDELLGAFSRSARHIIQSGI